MRLSLFAGAALGVSGAVGVQAASALIVAPSITQSAVSGSFYTNAPNTGDFNRDFQGATLKFTQQFPSINFNSDPGVSPCPAGSNTRPTQEGIQNPDGTCSYVAAQSADGTEQAGVNDLFTFTAVFTGTYTVSGPQTVTFTSYSDDGQQLGVGPSNGNQPTYAGGANDEQGNTTPVHHYQIVGAAEGAFPPQERNYQVYFPAAGTYPFEVDYSECCDGQLANVLLVNGSVLEAPVSFAARGTLSGTGAGGSAAAAQFAAINDCNAAQSTRGFVVQWGGNTFRRTSTTSTSCSKDPSIPYQPNSGVNSQTGTANGTLNGAPATISWTFKDEAPGYAPPDNVQITIMDASGNTVFSAPGQYPAPFGSQPGGVEAFNGH